MTYEIVTEPHTCELPPPENFEFGVEIRCTKPRLRNGHRTPCNRLYERGVRGTFRRRYAWISIPEGW